MPSPSPFLMPIIPFPMDFPPPSSPLSELAVPDMSAYMLPARDLAPASAPAASHALSPGGSISVTQSDLSAPPHNPIPSHPTALPPPSGSSFSPTHDPLGPAPKLSAPPFALMSLPEALSPGCRRVGLILSTKFTEDQAMREKQLLEFREAACKAKELELREMQESHLRDMAELSAVFQGVLNIDERRAKRLDALEGHLSSLVNTRSPADESKPKDPNNPYQILLRKFKELGRAYEPRPIPCIPLPYSSIADLPKEFRRAKLGEHGEYFDKRDVTVPLSGNAGFMYVCHEDDIKGKSHWLKSATKKGDLEVSFSSESSDNMLYYGSFEPLCDEWFTFTKDVTGYLPELFSREGYDYCPRWHNLRVQWHNPDTKLRFCILQYKQFNHKYFKSLQDLATRTSQKRKLGDVEMAYTEQDSNSYPSRKRKTQLA